MDCLPGWVVERQDYADLRMHVSTVPGIPVNRRTSQPEANPTQEKLGKKVAIGPLFPTANIFSWVGIGFIYGVGS